MEEPNDSKKQEETGKIISGFQDQLFRFAFFRTGSMDNAQDIVQDVFVRFFKQNTTALNIKNYLLKSVANACIDFNKKNKKQVSELLSNMHQLPITSANEASNKILQIEEYKRISDLLSHLPQEQAEVIQLKVIDELSFVEIAQLTNLPVTTVKSRFKYGIDKLKTIMNSKLVQNEL